MRKKKFNIIKPIKKRRGKKCGRWFRTEVELSVIRERERERHRERESYLKAVVLSQQGGVNWFDDD